MSHWRFKREADGKVTATTVEVTWLVQVAVVALTVIGANVALVLFFGNVVARLATVALLLGFALFVVAKVSVIRTGRTNSWGSGSMSDRNRWCYRAGYVLMGIGAVTGIALAVAAHIGA